jgi:hypothetical protein
MLYSEIIAVCSQIHTKHINTLCGQNVEFVNVELGGTYSDHWNILKSLRLPQFFWMFAWTEDIIALIVWLLLNSQNTWTEVWGPVQSNGRFM